MACKDKSITFLKKFGYNVIRLPKADLSPLQMFINQKGMLQPLGELNSVFKSSTSPLPVIKRDTAVATLSGQKTSDLSLGIGLSILGGVIGAMGGSKLGLDAAYKNARSLVFSYGEILEDSIQVTELDKFLTTADVDPSSRHVAELLEADEVFVLTSVIKSKTITVEAKKKDDTEVKVDIPVIKEVVGGNVDIKPSSQNDSAVTYAGAIPLAFGFKAVKLSFEDGVYRRFDPAKDGSVTIALKNVPDSDSMFISQGSFVVISKE
jgi:hypothetical protein